MHNRRAASTLFIAATIGFVACGKEERKSETANAEERKDHAAAVEAEKRSALIAEMAAEQRNLELKIKAAVERLGKQGNKTRKKLQPKFASLEAQRSEISGALEKLQALPNPDFIEKSNDLRNRQDSLSRFLSVLEKSMK